MISFTVNAVPVPQPRQRMAAVATRTGRISVHNYLPKLHPANRFKAAVVYAHSQASQGQGPFRGPIKLDIEFVLARPLSMMRKRRDNHRIRDTRKKADLDNLCKCVMDALNTVAWHDDCQVVELHATKWIASGNEQPKATVIIKETDDARID